MITQPEEEVRARAARTSPSSVDTLLCLLYTLYNEKGARVRQSARAIANLLQIDAEKLPWFVCVTPADFEKLNPSAST
jgi:hypothetical protein